MEMETVEAECTYGRYLGKQAKEAAALRRVDAVALPPHLWPCAAAPWAVALKHEVREKLHEMQPASLGAARRIRGVTPAALVALRLQALRSAHARKA